MLMQASIFRHEPGQARDKELTDQQSLMSERIQVTY